MESDERSAGDRYRCGHAGHHVVIPAAMVRIFVADGTNHGELVRDFCEFRDGFAELNAWNFCRDGFEFATNFGRGVRLGIERFIMRRAAVHPDEDAVNVFSRAFAPGFRAVRAESKKIAESKAERATQADLDEIAPGHATTV